MTATAKHPTQKNTHHFSPAKMNPQSHLGHETNTTMFLVIELRRGDIAQTWALTATRDAAVHRLAALMREDATSWWKILEIDTPSWMTNSPPGAQFWVAVEVDYEDDNEIRFLSLVDQFEMLPFDVRNSDDAWIDSVHLIR